MSLPQTRFGPPGCAGRCGPLVCGEELPDEAADAPAVAGREPLLLPGRESGAPAEVETPASALAAACAATCKTTGRGQSQLLPVLTLASQKAIHTMLMQLHSTHAKIRCC